MNESISLTHMVGQAVGRTKYDVTVTWKDGHVEEFADAAIHHVDGWVILQQFNSENWHVHSTSGLRGDHIMSYTMRERR